MNPTLSTVPLERRRKTYVKAVVFVFPSVIIAQFINAFVLPKFMEVQRDAGISDAQLMNLITMARFSARYGVAFLALCAVFLLLMEWRFRLWPRYRKAVLGLLVFAVNTSVLMQLATMLIALAILAPMLRAK